MTTMPNIENRVYRVVAEEDLTDPRLFAYIISAKQLNKLKSVGLGNIKPIASSIPIMILGNESSLKDAPKLVRPTQFFEGEFPDSLALATEWEKLVTDFLGIPIVGNVILSQKDIFAKEHFSIHPEIDVRVQEAITKLNETHS